MRDPLRLVGQVTLILLASMLGLGMLGFAVLSVTNLAFTQPEEATYAISTDTAPPNIATDTPLTFTVITTGPNVRLSATTPSTSLAVGDTPLRVDVPARITVPNPATGSSTCIPVILRANDVQLPMLAAGETTTACPRAPVVDFFSQYPLPRGPVPTGLRSLLTYLEGSADDVSLAGLPEGYAYCLHLADPDIPACLDTLRQPSQDPTLAAP